MKLRSLLLATLLAGSVFQARATITLFDLVGTAGPGLLFGNEPAVASGGTGGEIGSGIFFDSVAMTLSVTNVGWGSSQGFTDLSSTANNSHIHVTTNNFGNDGTGNFKLTGAVLFTLARSSSLVSGGTFTTPPITLTAAQQTDLFNGRYYINIHTLNNGGGELRGFLVAVPEPSVLALSGVGLGLLVIRRRRRR